MTQAQAPGDCLIGPYIHPALGNQSRTDRQQAPPPMGRQSNRWLAFRVAGLTNDLVPCLVKVVECVYLSLCITDKRCHLCPEPLDFMKRISGLGPTLRLLVNNIRSHNLTSAPSFLPSSSSLSAGLAVSLTIRGRVLPVKWSTY